MGKDTIGKGRKLGLLKVLISILVVCILCFAYAVYNEPRASEKIKGVFGLTLGEPIDSSIVVFKDNDSLFTNYHTFTPTKEKRSPLFDKYYVSITPKTRRVASIRAVGYYERLKFEDVSKRRIALMYLLWKKYGIGDFEGSATKIEQQCRGVRIGIEIKYRFESREVLGIEVYYYDGDMLKLQNQEREELIKEKEIQKLEKLGKQLDMRGL